MSFSGVKTALLSLPIFFTIDLIPGTVSALTLVQVAELFNIFVGLMLAMALLVFSGGLFVYFSRLGTWPSHRDTGIKIMEWGVGILFVLIVILAIVQFFEKYPRVSSIIVGGIVLLAVGYFAFTVARKSAEDKKKEH